ncbi:ferroxidase fet3 [Podochytrium sp. JEL0797]|nr:ferroxidase fet3 [Podochytrium sp. JEL0797]
MRRAALLICAAAVSISSALPSQTQSTAAAAPPPAFTESIFSPNVAPIVDWNACGPSVGTSVCATPENVCCVAPGDAATQLTTCRPPQDCIIVSAQSAPLPGPEKSLITSSTPQTTVTLYWKATNFTQNLDGVARYALGINNVPGFNTPINVNAGDRIVIYFTNGLNVPTSLHFHGMLQRGSGFSDGPSGVTQCPIAPGQSYIYDFTTDGLVGTFWWHAHYHLHQADGLRGPLIIRDPTESKNYASEATLQLSDWYHAQSEPLLAWYLNGTTNPDGNEPVWDSGLINGIGQFDCSQLKSPSGCLKMNPFVQMIQQGTTVRLRLINTSIFAAFLFSIDGHSLTVIEVDGVLVKPKVVDQLTINTAQRYSVLITALQKPGNYLIRANMYHGDPWTSMPNMPIGFNPNVTAVLNYNGINPSLSPLKIQPPPKPVTLNDMALVPQIPSPTSRTMTRDLVVLLEFEFEARPGDLYQKAYPTTTLFSKGLWTQLFSSSFYANGSSPTLLQAHTQGSTWTPDPIANAIPIHTNQTIDIILRNDDPGEHPFHLHGHVVWVLASGFANSLASIPQRYPTTNPLRRDVVTVPACPHDEDGCLPSSTTNFDGFVPPLGASNLNALPESSSTSNATWFGYTIIRFTADNPGIWLMHCHISWHMAAGLAVTFVESVEQLGNTIQKPVQTESTCRKFNQWMVRKGESGSSA